MAKPRLLEVAIRPDSKGNHHVRKTFEASPSIRRGAVMGAMNPAAPPGIEEKSFGPKDGHNMLRHVAQALALKGVMGAPPGQPGAQPSAGPAEEEPEEEE